MEAIFCWMDIPCCTINIWRASRVTCTSNECRVEYREGKEQRYIA
jgi:hypothetical protein